MKLSLAWVFRHIGKNSLLKFQPEFESGVFFERLGATIAEIESFEKVTYPLEDIFYATLIKNETAYTFEIPQLTKQITLPARADLSVSNSCLVIKKGDTYRYLTFADLHATKEGLVPAVWVADHQVKGGWKEGLSSWDYILTFDNKALTHRPDLWGHRGFAREVAALYNLELLADDYIFAQRPIRAFDTHAPATAGNVRGVENNDPEHCMRVAGFTITFTERRASIPEIVFRLCAVDAKPMNAIIDGTNFVMYDLGQPMHAFDAVRIEGPALQVNRAKAGEKLLLLDGTTITLTDNDTVISDGTKTLGLAGIMGGKASGIASTTQTFFLESASYKASAIRMSAQQHKIRTEASTRFEKSLDPLGNTQAIMRFLHICDTFEVPYQGADAILSVGAVPQPITINFSHAFIQERIGMSVSLSQIMAILQGLGLGVQQKDTGRGVNLTVTVPSFRATKDIRIAEDIVEEIARFIGYQNLPMELPKRPMAPFSKGTLSTERELKRLCAYGFLMHEVSNYPLYDNSFLKKLGIVPETTYTLANPVSENWTHLVSSLIPHLLKNVDQNVHLHDTMTFFEMNKVWKGAGEKVNESPVFGGLWYQSHELDFYHYKEKVVQLFALLGRVVLWRAPLHPLAPWYHPYQTAELVYEDKVIGHAGIVRPDIMRTLSSGHAFITEWNMSPLLTPRQDYTLQPISPYQPVTTDISLLVPVTVSVDALEQAIAGSDARIYALQLVDYFENKEWQGQRAVTLRYTAVDDEKTFSKEDIEQLRAQVSSAVLALGATIR